jgi:hypothetical protein
MHIHPAGNPALDRQDQKGLQVTGRADVGDMCSVRIGGGSGNEASSQVEGGGHRRTVAQARARSAATSDTHDVGRQGAAGRQTHAQLLDEPRARGDAEQQR